MDTKGKSMDIINEVPSEYLEQFINLWQTILLFKYLDAREDLSIQVHPNDALQKAQFI
jgi:mannose-6-phosphate isomerase